MENEALHTPGEPSITSLQQRLASGDPDAMEMLYRRYFHSLCNYALQVSSEVSLEQVEDIVQEFFLRLSHKPHKIAQVRNLEAYMFRAIRNNTLSRLETQQRHQLHNAEMSEGRDRTELSPEGVQILAEDGKHRTQLLRQALSELPPSQREAISLRFFEEKSYEEIAEILSVSQQVAYNYVFRGLKRLRKQMGKWLTLFLLSIGLWWLF